MKSFILVLLSSFALTAGAQNEFAHLDTLGNKFKYPDKFEEKLLWGFSYHSGWSTLTGVDSLQTFTKPGVGAGVMIQYFPMKWLGFSVGIGHQMRGTGIITRDDYQALGERDSTYRCRFRTNNINIPIQLMIRSPFTILRTGKISLAIGITPTKIYMAKRIFLSVEDGFHDVTSIKGNFLDGFDTPIRLGAGWEFNAGNTALFRTHFIAEFGMKNLYTSPLLNTTTGKNKLFGIEINFLF